MQMLIVGIGALGGTIAARALRAGLPVRLAARNTESAEVLRRSGLRVSSSACCALVASRIRSNWFPFP